MDKKKLDHKYAELLLKKCLNFKYSNTLLIEYTSKELDDFVKIVIEEAKKMDIKNIRVCLADNDELHDYLNTTKLKDIKFNSLLDKTCLDEVSKECGCILHIKTFIPDLMKDIDSEKLTKANKIFADTFPYYRKNNNKYNFPWVMCAYPNERWAKFLFKDDENAYLKLYEYIMEMCLVDKDNPIEEWNSFIKENNYYKEKLQELEIRKLHYKNSLGTDFEIGFCNNKWINLDKKDNFGNPIIVNMPSYEVFTTPDCRTANGVVYNSRPLVFNGKIIDNFHIVFKDGQVIYYKAKVGNDSLKSLIEDYTNSNRLGEVALVNNNSPISNTGIVFYNTLFDENASCHLALGNGKLGAINNGNNLTQEELDSIGFNKSNVHVDFMIGTSDLNIEADTNRGKQLIFKNGNFNL